MRNTFLDTLDGFLSGELSLDALQGWMLSNLQSIINSGDDEMIEAANAMDATIVDLGEGIVGDQELTDQVIASFRSMLNVRLHVFEDAKVSSLFDSVADTFISEDSALLQA